MTCNAGNHRYLQMAHKRWTAVAAMPHLENIRDSFHTDILNAESYLRRQTLEEKKNPAFLIHLCNGNPGYPCSFYTPIAVKSLLCFWLYNTWHNKRTNYQHYIAYTEEEMEPRKIQNMTLGQPDGGRDCVV